MLYIKCSTGDSLHFCFTATKKQASYINENLLPKGYSLQKPPIGQDKKNKKTKKNSKAQKKIVKHKKQQKINKIKNAKLNNPNNSKQNIKITTPEKQIDQQIETILENQNHTMFFALQETPQNKKEFKQDILDHSEKQEDPEDFFRKIDNMNQLYKQYFTPPKL